MTVQPFVRPSSSTLGMPGDAATQHCDPDRHLPRCVVGASQHPTRPTGSFPHRPRVESIGPRERALRPRGVHRTPGGDVAQLSGTGCAIAMGSINGISGSRPSMDGMTTPRGFPRCGNTRFRASLAKGAEQPGAVHLGRRKSAAVLQRWSHSLSSRRGTRS